MLIFFRFDVRSFPSSRVYLTSIYRRFVLTYTLTGTGTVVLCLDTVIPTRIGVCYLFVALANIDNGSLLLLFVSFSLTHT